MNPGNEVFNEPWQRGFIGLGVSFSSCRRAEKAAESTSREFNKLICSTHVACCLLNMATSILQQRKNVGMDD